MSVHVIHYIYAYVYIKTKEIVQKRVCEGSSPPHEGQQLPESGCGRDHTDSGTNFD